MAKNFRYSQYECLAIVAKCLQRQWQGGATKKLVCKKAECAKRRKKLKLNQKYGEESNKKKISSFFLFSFYALL